MKIRKLFQCSLLLTFVCCCYAPLGYAQTPTLTTDDISARRVDPPAPPAATVATVTPEKNTPSPKTVNRAALPNKNAPRNVSSLNGRAIFTNAFTAMGQASSFRATMRVAGLPQTGAGNYDMEIEYAKPDRVHLKAADMEAIAVGGVSYVKMKGQGWKRTEQANIAGSGMSMDPARLQKMFETLFGQLTINAQLIGTETIDGVSASCYEFSVGGIAGKQGADMLSFRLWLGSADNLPRKLLMSAPDNKFHLEARLYDYNVPLQITAPSM